MASEGRFSIYGKLMNRHGELGPLTKIPDAYLKTHQIRMVFPFGRNLYDGPVYMYEPTAGDIMMNEQEVTQSSSEPQRSIRQLGRYPKVLMRILCAGRLRRSTFGRRTV